MRYINIYSVTLLIWTFASVAAGHMKIGNVPIKRTKSFGRFAVITFILIFGSFMAFRAESVGTDTRHYNQLFRNIANVEHVWNFYEFWKYPVYSVIGRLLSFVSKDPQIMVAFTGFFIVGANAFFIYRMSRDVMLSLYLYVVLDLYMFAFNITRQNFAMAVILLAYLRFEDSRPKQGIALIFLAMGCHSLGILGFAMVPLFVIKNQKKMRQIYLCGSFLFAAVGIRLATLFVRIFSFYTLSSSSGFSFFEADSSGNRMYTAFLILAIEGVGLYLFRVHEWSEEDRLKFSRLASISNIALFSMIFMRHYYAFARAERFFLQFVVVLIPLILSNVHKKNNYRIIKYMLAAVLFLPYVTKLYHYLPYANFWN